MRRNSTQIWNAIQIIIVMVIGFVVTLNFAAILKWLVSL